MIFSLYTVYKKHGDDYNWRLRQTKIVSINNKCSNNFGRLQFNGLKVISFQVNVTGLRKWLSIEVLPRLIEKIGHKFSERKDKIKKIHKISNAWLHVIFLKIHHVYGSIWSILYRTDIEEILVQVAKSQRLC